MAYTESSWDYHANHQGLYTNICGANPYYWQDYLDDINVDINSVAACVEIYKYYKSKHNGNKRLAIKSYKGISENTYLVDKTLRLRDKILKALNKNPME